ncbi:MAG: Fe2+-dependent dioxygenase [Pseudomonadota bacterium]|nr:Fe2+-dependent dioxygenase [Pseudomonadota bacterium]
MMIDIPDVLTPAQLAHCRQMLAAADWADGRQTAGHIAVSAKHNLQLPPTSATSVALGNLVLEAIGQNRSFIAAALPLKVLPPLFNRYEGGGHYGSHVDNAVRTLPGSAERVRTDISCTLFFSEPHEYDGGELVVQDTYGTRGVKLPAGHLVVYPGTSLHHVTPVTRGTRLAAFFWVQSLVRTDAQRSVLLELDTAIQSLTQRHPSDESLVPLTGVYHNLLRQWSNT